MQHIEEVFRPAALPPESRAHGTEPGGFCTHLMVKTQSELLFPLLHKSGAYFRVTTSAVCSVSLTSECTVVDKITVTFHIMV